MKNKLAKIVGTFGIFGIGSLGFSSYGQDTISSQNKIYSEKFHVNLNDTLQYIIKRDKWSGLREIFQLNKTQNYEEAWLYLPIKEEWYEIGIESEGTLVKQDLQKVEKILNEYKNECVCSFLRKDIYFIHNHPPSNCAQGLSRGDLVALAQHSILFDKHDVQGIVVEGKGMIEYSLNPRTKEEFFKKNKKDLKIRKIEKFMKLPYAELSKFFNIKTSKFEY